MAKRQQNDWSVIVDRLYTLFFPVSNLQGEKDLMLHSPEKQRIHVHSRESLSNFISGTLQLHAVFPCLKFKKRKKRTHLPWVTANSIAPWIAIIYRTNFPSWNGKWSKAHLSLTGWSIARKPQCLHTKPRIVSPFLPVDNCLRRTGESERVRDHPERLLTV